MGYQLGLVKEDRSEVTTKCRKDGRGAAGDGRISYQAWSSGGGALLAERDGVVAGCSNDQELLRRPEIGMDDRCSRLGERRGRREIRSQLEIECKYEGYIKSRSNK